MDIGEAIGLVIGALIAIPIIGLALVFGISVIALQVAVFVAIVGYIIGIPWSIYFRVRHGRWPEN